MRRLCSSDGSVAPLLALLVVVTAGLMVGVVRVAGDAVAVGRARAAADAAALAGAAGGEEAARGLAKLNGGRLDEWSVEGSEVEVTVRASGATATARAVGRRVHGSAGSRVGLDPAMVAALAEAERLLGEPIPITSGWRSPAEQARLWARRATNPFPVAPPGVSLHERGMAVDVPRTFVARLARVAEAAGLCQPLPRTDPVHFELCRARTPSR